MSDEKPESEKVRVLAVNYEDRQTIVERDNGDVGMIMKCEEGQPLHGDLVTCTETDEPGVIDLTTVYKNPSGSKGPAKVTSKAFRNNWDSVFSKKKVKKEDLN